MAITNDKKFEACNTGVSFWRDTAICHGTEEALIICSNHLDMNLKCAHSEYEGEFCRELFITMYEATARKIDIRKLIYPYSLEEAHKRTESSCFYANANLNKECARDIDEAITASHYQTNHYNLNLVAMKVILVYGFERVNAVLAHHLQGHKNDGRYSQSNKDWAATVAVTTEAFGNIYLSSHAILVEDVTKHARSLYSDLGATRFALPGHEEHGEFIKGYEIKRAIKVDYNQGYALAHNPNAVDPFVCWQFYIRDGERHYNWGVYGEEQTAVDSYNARVFVAFN